MTFSSVLTCKFCSVRCLGFQWLLPSLSKFPSRSFKSCSKLHSSEFATNPYQFTSKTNVIKDIVLFRNDKKNYYILVNLLSGTQFIFWNFLSYAAYTTMKNIPVDKTSEAAKALPWIKRANFGRFRIAFTFSFLLLGWGMLALTVTFTMRSLNLLVLCKGGQQLTFITHTPFGVTRSMTVPVVKVSAKQSRLSAGSFLPLKVQGKPLNFLLDMKGEFTNSQLFDYSAGLRRAWHK